MKWGEWKHKYTSDDLRIQDLNWDKTENEDIENEDPIKNEVKIEEIDDDDDDLNESEHEPMVLILSTNDKTGMTLRSNDETHCVF